MRPLYFVKFVSPLLAGLDIGFGPWCQKSMVRVFCIVVSLLTSVSALAESLVPYVKPDASPQSVILITVDALRARHLSAYGYSRPTTPTMDALAREGVLFERYYVNANWTRPSTASIMTGLLPSEHEVETDGATLNGPYQTLAEVAKSKGYRTGAVVGNGNAGGAFGFSRGFEWFQDTRNNWKGLPNAEEVFTLGKEYLTSVQKETPTQPFFLWLFTVDPHDPYHAPGDYETMFVRDPTVKLVRSPHWEKRKYTKAQINRMVDTYDGAIRYVDDQLAQLVKVLKQRGLYDSTTIVITSDHGEGFGEHGYFLHAHHLFEEFIHVPLIVKPAKSASFKAGTRVDTPTDSRDLFHSLSLLMGAQHQSLGEQGRCSWVHGGPPCADSLIVSEFGNFGIPRRAVIEGDKKVIYYGPVDKERFMATVGNPAWLPSVSFTNARWMYFDLKKDPGERSPVPKSRISKSAIWQKLKSVGAERQPSLSKISTIKIDDDTIEDLRALGYID